MDNETKKNRTENSKFFIMANFKRFSSDSQWEITLYIKKVGCSSCEYSLGIAKHLYIRTERQPTCMSCPLCLVYTFDRFGDFNEYLRHFPCNLPTMSLPRKACTNIQQTFVFVGVNMNIFVLRTY